jgi:hypothetical protein
MPPVVSRRHWTVEWCVVTGRDPVDEEQEGTEVTVSDGGGENGLSTAPVLRELALAFDAGDWAKLRQMVSEDVVVVDIASGREPARG